MAAIKVHPSPCFTGATVELSCNERLYRIKQCFEEILIKVLLPVAHLTHQRRGLKQITSRVAGVVGYVGVVKGIYGAKAVIEEQSLPL